MNFKHCIYLKWLDQEALTEWRYRIIWWTIWLVWIFSQLFFLQIFLFLCRLVLTGHTAHTGHRIRPVMGKLYQDMPISKWRRNDFMLLPKVVKTMKSLFTLNHAVFYARKHSTFSGLNYIIGVQGTSKLGKHCSKTWVLWCHH